MTFIKLCCSFGRLQLIDALALANSLFILLFFLFEKKNLTADASTHALPYSIRGLEILGCFEVQGLEVKKTW